MYFTVVQTCPLRGALRRTYAMLTPPKENDTRCYAHVRSIKYVCGARKIYHICVWYTLTKEASWSIGGDV